MKSVLSVAERDTLWDKLTSVFPQVPADISFETGTSTGPEMKLETSVLACEFLIDGERIVAAGGGRLPWADASIRVWNRRTGKELLVCRAHTWGVHALALDRRTGFIASASEDRSVVLLNLDRQDAIFLIGDDEIVRGHLAFAPDRFWLAIGEIGLGGNNSVFVLNLNSGTEVFRRFRGERVVSALAIMKNGQRLVLSSSSRYGAVDAEGDDVYCWDLPTRKTVWKNAVDKTAVWQLQWMPERNLLVGGIIVEDIPTGTLSGVCLLDGESGKVLAKRLLPGIGASVDVSPDGSEIVVAYGEGTIEVLQPFNLTLIRTLIQGRSPKSGFCYVKFSPEGDCVIAGTGDIGEVKVFPNK